MESKPDKETAPRINNPLELAARNADWAQVVQNGGPPCFHFEGDLAKFCLRAKRWPGHAEGEWPSHKFVPLEELLRIVAAECRAPAPQPDWKKEALALVVLLRAKCSDEEWASMESRFAAATPQVTPELELEQEADGRWLAAYTRFHGVAAYGHSKEEAIRNAAKVLIESTPEQASYPNDPSLMCAEGRHKECIGSNQPWWVCGCACHKKASEQASPREFKPYMEDHEYYDSEQASPTPERCPDCGSQNRDFRRTMETDVVNGSNQRVNLERSYSPCSHPWHSSAGTPKAGRDEKK